eukprot:CAMPEP_0174901636 /NCGR_PEP_ID=MMETSP0167-20121228/35202_1 /TAXON_ID=38298 /ORGANISM="Rhodella maculata, Strain CCMP736" /LENGTH=105 /DNA_ID=CAMNT_0016143357 /DNA_START=122 /DNA_END=439 /DNA_ORIENTATION=-
MVLLNTTAPPDWKKTNSSNTSWLFKLYGTPPLVTPRQVKEHEVSVARQPIPTTYLPMGIGLLKPTWGVRVRSRRASDVPKGGAIVFLSKTTTGAFGLTVLLSDSA